MRLRNNTDGALTVGAHPAVVLQPGDEIDYDGHVIGLTPVDEEPVTTDEELTEAAPEATAQEAPAGKAKRARTTKTEEPTP